MNSDPLPLEIFSDFVCPWCYLASAVVARVQQKRDLTVHWRPFPLHPSTPATGMPLDELLRGIDLEAVHQKLYALMDEFGLEHGPRRNTYNSRLAQELALWASTQVNGDALPPLLFRAYFVHDRNLADAGVLLDAVDQAGLDSETARTVLEQRSFSAAVDESWALARQYGISGVPAFLAGGYQLTGFQPEEALLRFIDYVKAQQLDSA